MLLTMTDSQLESPAPGHADHGFSFAELVLCVLVIQLISPSESVSFIS